MKRRAILAGIAALLAPRSLIAQTPSHDGPRRLGVLMGNLADDPHSTGTREEICGLTGAGPGATPPFSIVMRRNWWSSAATYCLRNRAPPSWRCGGQQARSP